jgi:hypothetical protein
MSISNRPDLKCYPNSHNRLSAHTIYRSKDQQQSVDDNVHKTDRGHPGIWPIGPEASEMEDPLTDLGRREVPRLLLFVYKR